MDNKVRVRFAPSPTGALHIGGVRTALYNYLFAKKHGGDFILRIEDTDSKRFVDGAEKYIIEALKWCGISNNEGQGVGGDFAPYKQSERKKLYKKYCDFLLKENKAYYAFDSSEELDLLRKEYEKEKKTFTYNSQVRNKLKNSLSLSEEEIKTKIDSGEKYVVRFKMPEDEILNITDIIRGDMQVNTSSLDDKILFKSDGMPTYHLANVVDDYLMKISHVIRGEEWLPSMPLHVLLYKSFDWAIPKFAHLPLLLKPTGKGKLSKRDGDKLGFPVFPLQWGEGKNKSMGYREEGYFAEAFINIIAMLGWNPGVEKEIFSLEELVEAFSLEKVGKSGARFNLEKAKWFNQQWMKIKSNTEIAELFMEKLKEKNISEDIEYVKKITSLVKDRATFTSDLWEQSYFFFQSPTEYDTKIIKKRWKENMNENISNIKDSIKSIDDFKKHHIHEATISIINHNNLNMGQVMNSIRLCLVGTSKGPDLFDIMEVIGKEETIKRLELGIENIHR